jgi:KaiC/GvpD/RAD55 family RecA-like ATPase
MSKRENGIASVAEATEKMELTSATEILHQWNLSLADGFADADSTSVMPDNSVVVELLNKWSNTAENLQRLIIDEMIGRHYAKDKEEFIRMVQLMLTKLLDKVSLVCSFSSVSINDKQPGLLTQELLKALHFIQEYFGTYFDKNERVPDVLISFYKKEINALSESLQIKLSSSDSTQQLLTETLHNHFISSFENQNQPVTYRLHFYEKELIRELSKEVNPATDSIRKLLYYYNFNSSAFVIYEFDRLVNMLSAITTKSEKILMLRSELKTINQLPVRVNYYFDENMPSLKEQVSTWITEEIKYCEAGNFIQAAISSGTEPENKINTTLSVAKLGLLIRLLVVDKIIINRTVAPMLRTVAKTFTTLQREEISFGSLETKYHAPDKATIGVMKDMLHKWIHILSKL